MNEPQQATPSPRASRTVRQVTAGGQMRPLLVGAAVVVALVVIIVVAGRYDRAGQRDPGPPPVTPGRIQVEGAPGPTADSGQAAPAEAEPTPPTPVHFYQVLTQGREKAPVGGGDIAVRSMPLPPPPDADGTGEAPAAKSAPAPQAAPEPVRAEAVPAEPATPEPVAAPAQEAPAPESAVGGKPYSLQVGSFSQRDAADDLANRLTTQGFDAFLVEVDLKAKGTWWRVRVGRYPTEYAARWARLELVKQGLSPIVVRDRNGP